MLRRLTTGILVPLGQRLDVLLGGGVDYPIYSRILAIQRIVLNQCFAPSMLSRIQNQELQAEPKSQAVEDGGGLLYA